MSRRSASDRDNSNSTRASATGQVQFSSRIYGNLQRDGNGGSEARLLMGRVGVRVDILPALCHRRDIGGGRVRDG